MWHSSHEARLAHVWVGADNDSMTCRGCCPTISVHMRPCVDSLLAGVQPDLRKHDTSAWDPCAFWHNHMQQHPPAEGYLAFTGRQGR